MEGPDSSLRHAATFALVSWLLRLVAVQSSIIGLWYSRRSYERSRGEMITMIFEKTLGRKIIGAPKKPEHTEHVNGDFDVSPKAAKEPTISPKMLFQRLCTRVRKVFRSDQPAKDVKEPASMGKILNLMR